MGAYSMSFGQTISAFDRFDDPVFDDKAYPTRRLSHILGAKYACSSACLPELDLALSEDQRGYERMCGKHLADL